MAVIQENIKWTGQGKEQEILRKSLRREQYLLTRKKVLGSRKLVFGGIIVLFITLTALFAPVLATQSPYLIDVPNRLLPPSTEHWFGTDSMGRDVFSRVIYGTRISITVGLCVGLISGITGMVIGLYASYSRLLDNILMRICDGLKAIPSIMLAIMLMAVLGGDIKNIILCLVMGHIPNMARIARSSALGVREKTYIIAMRSLGAKPSRILWGHIAPNVLSPILVQMTMAFASAIVAEAALSFIGAGIPAPSPSWGNILSEGKDVIYNAWWMIMFPGLFIMVSVLGLNLAGEGIRDLLDPQSR